MRCFLLPSLCALLLSLLTLLPLASSQSSPYLTAQWGYILRCQPYTIDYPCLIQVIGTATLNSTLRLSASLSQTTSSGAATYRYTNVSYYNVVAFTGTRTHTNKYGVSASYPITLTPAGDARANTTNVYLSAPYISNQAFRLQSAIQFPGGLLGDEWYATLNPYPSETISFEGGNGNALNNLPSGTLVCSTAPGFTAAAYNATSEAAAGSINMADCTGATLSPAAASSAPTADVTATGLRVYQFSYTTGDGVTYLSYINATLYTDGTVNVDQLGNVYYQLISIAGTRTYTYIPTATTSTHNITSLMAQNIVPSSNLAYITNNNRLYPTFPYLDRYGIAFTLDSNVAVDGSSVAQTDIFAVLVYRESTLEEYTMLGGGNYPPTNLLDVPEPITLTQIAPQPTYQLVQWCYVLYGLNGTLDYPWSSVLTATILIDNSTVLATNASYALPSGTSTVPYYPTIGAVGYRNFTNRYGVSTITSLTLNALGEDRDSNQLWLTSPYASSLSWHLNTTIQTPGGLPATDLSVYLNPYPIEGTAYGFGVGTGTNALNNDPSRTLFASTAPNFAPSTYSNVPLTAINATTVGLVQGTQGGFSQCVASFAVQTASAPAAGIRVYQFTYTLQGGNATSTLAYTASAALQLTTDGSVQRDALGNYYFNVAAISGQRNMTWLATGATTTSTVSALLPICSGPSVSNIDSVYCNNNRLYQQYPYIDRLGLAWEFSALAPQPGSVVPSTRFAGVYVYRETAIEEANPANGGYPTWSDAPAQSISLVQLNTSVAPANANASALTYTAVQWGYIMYCDPFTIDAPCSTAVSGTAIIQVGATVPTTSGIPYYKMVGFVGTRTYTNKYAVQYVSNISIAQSGEDFGDEYLLLLPPYVDSNGFTYRLNGTDGALTQMPGGLLGNEINVYNQSAANGPYPVETIAIASLTASSTPPSNSLNFDPSRTVFCSTAPGFTPAGFGAYGPYTPQGTTNMSLCISNITTPATKPSAAQTATGFTRAFQFTYSVTDGATYVSTGNLTMYTDGTTNYDALGNLYYQLISITGTRTYTFLATATTSTHNITSLMAQNIVPTSNRPDITNNNRLYLSYPYIDRYGIAFTVDSNVAVDGSALATTDIIGLVVYRESTLEEYTVFGGGNYPATNWQNAALPIALTPLAAPPSYQLVQWCYVLYGLNGTLDYPWSSVLTATILIDNSTVLATNASYALPSGTSTVPYYPTIGAVGYRNFTNRYGVSTITSLTLNALGEDRDSNQLWLTSPYASSLSWHLNTTIQTPGGLPATDLSVYLNPYPIEGTAYGFGVGTGTNALNNDPSRTLFASTAPNFAPSTYSNVPLTAINATTVGLVQGTQGGFSQCVASFAVQTASAPAAGIRVYQFTYTLQGGNATSTLAYTASAALQLTTDGSVQRDALGNYYFNVAAISGQRNMTWLATGATTTSTVSALLPICSGPSVSNIDSVYCNNNRLYQQYPYIDRLGLAWEFSALAPQPGSVVPSTRFAGVYVYRETAIEEANPANGGYPTWSDAPAQSISLVQLNTSVAPANANASALTYTAVQWGYIMYCDPFTIDAPCSTAVSGTAIIQVGATVPTTSGIPYYKMVGFVGTRTYTNKYAVQYVSNISIAQSGEDFGDEYLLLLPPYVDSNGFTYRLNGTDGALTQMPGGLLGNEINVYNQSAANGPYPVETIAIASLTASSTPPSNSLNFDPSRTVFCSTAPGFTPAGFGAYGPYTPQGTTNMSLCISNITTPATKPSAAQTATGFTRAFQFTYSVTDGATYVSTGNLTMYTDGTTNYDALGNLYYQLISITGTRTYTFLATATTSTHNITSLMAQNIVPTSNRPDITNNNRLYLSYPYIDRYGIAFTVDSNVAVDGSALATTDIIGLVVYRESTLEEYTVFGGGNYPATNWQNAALPIALTPLAAPPSYQLVQWCYVLYGLNGTLDYPWSSVLTATILIDNSTVLATNASYALPSGTSTVPYYPTIGAVGYRNFTNRYGVSTITSLTLNALGEDRDSNQLWLTSPYASSLSWHLNTTIQTPGGLPATDLSVYLNPYPIEGTAYGFGVGTGTNALNNDPSRTLFASTAPNFAPSTYSNVPLTAINATTVGLVQGTQGGFSQCVASFAVQTASAPAAGIRVYQFTYTLQGGNATSTLAYTASAALQLTTDGSVQRDALGNYYFNVAAISGQRNMTRTWPTGTTQQVHGGLLCSPSAPARRCRTSTRCTATTTGCTSSTPTSTGWVWRGSSVRWRLSPAVWCRRLASRVCTCTERRRSRRRTLPTAATRRGRMRRRRASAWCSSTPAWHRPTPTHQPSPTRRCSGATSCTVTPSPSTRPAPPQCRAPPSSR